MVARPLISVVDDDVSVRESLELLFKFAHDAAKKDRFDTRMSAA